MAAAGRERGNEGRSLEQVLVFSAKANIAQDLIGFEKLPPQLRKGLSKDDVCS